MTRHFCDICGKPIASNSGYYMLNSDRVTAFEHKYTFSRTEYEAVPATYEPYKPISMDLCKECYEDLTEYISRKTLDNLEKTEE